MLPLPLAVLAVPHFRVAVRGHDLVGRADPMRRHARAFLEHVGDGLHASALDPRGAQAIGGVLVVAQRAEDNLIIAPRHERARLLGV